MELDFLKETIGNLLSENLFTTVEETVASLQTKFPQCMFVLPTDVSPGFSGTVIDCFHDSKVIRFTVTKA